MLYKYLLRLWAGSYQRRRRLSWTACSCSRMLLSPLSKHLEEGSKNSTWLPLIVTTTKCSRSAKCWTAACCGGARRSTVQTCPTAASCLIWSTTSTLRTLGDRLDGSAVGTLKRLQHLRRAMLWLLRACVASCRPFCQTRKWNVHDATLTHDDRTNNPRESWNNGFRQLVGHSHPGVWTMIESLQLDQAMSVTSLMQHARGQLPPKRVRRTTVQLQKRHRTYRSTGLGTATSLLYCWLFQCRDCYYGFYVIL